MDEHPMHIFTETYIAERLQGRTKQHHTGEWVEVIRFPTLADAVAYVRVNSPTFSPWRVVRLRTEQRREVLDSQPIPDLPATPKESHR